MYRFLARRIHEGFLTWDEVNKKKFASKVKEAYREMYPEEVIE